METAITAFNDVLPMYVHDEFGHPSPDSNNVLSGAIAARVVATRQTHL